MMANLGVCSALPWSCSQYRKYFILEIVCCVMYFPHSPCNNFIPSHHRNLKTCLTSTMLSWLALHLISPAVTFHIIFRGISSFVWTSFTPLRHGAHGRSNHCNSSGCAYHDPRTSSNHPVLVYLRCRAAFQSTSTRYESSRETRRVPH